MFNDSDDVAPLFEKWLEVVVVIVTRSNLFFQNVKDGEKNNEKQLRGSKDAISPRVKIYGQQVLVVVVK